MIDPHGKLSLTEQKVFGHDAKKHILGFVIEVGSGSLPVEQQAANYIRDVEYFEGPAAAEALRAKLKTAAVPLRVVK